MNERDQLIEIAKLDGKEEWEYNPNNPAFGSLLYLTSLDAIVPVIEKQTFSIQYGMTRIIAMMRSGGDDKEYRYYPQDMTFYGRLCMTATPRQLCEALLRATGKWKD